MRQQNFFTHLTNALSRYAQMIQNNIVAALKNKEESPSFEEIDQLIKGQVT